MPERDTRLFKIGIGQMREYRNVDVVASQCCGVSLQADLRQPVKPEVGVGSDSGGFRGLIGIGVVSLPGS